MEEITRGLNPLNGDSDGDGVPDHLDMDYLLDLEEEVIFAFDEEMSNEDFISGLSSEVDLVRVTVEELNGSKHDSPYIVLAGRPDGENGTVGSIIGDILEDSPETYEQMVADEGGHIAVRYGCWNSTQTVIMLSDITEYDDEKVVSMLKSMRMTVTEDAVSVSYQSPRACFLLNHPEVMMRTGTASAGKLIEMVNFTVNVSKVSGDEVTLPFTSENGLGNGERQVNDLINFEMKSENGSEASNLLALAQLNILYTAEDLEKSGGVNESTLSLYWLDDDIWVRVAEDLEWVNGLELNTTNFFLYGIEYEGYIRLDSSHFSLYGIAGRPINPDPPYAFGGVNITVTAGTLVTLDGSLSSSGVEIVNYTWMIYDTVLHSVNVSFVFDDPGVYEVMLTVKDQLGRKSSHSFFITVLAPDPTDFTFIFGPVLDEENTPVGGAMVTLKFFNLEVSNQTDTEGNAEFLLPLSLLNTSLNITIEADGYDLQYMDTIITSEGDLGAMIPRLKFTEIEEPEEEDSSPLVEIILLIILISLILIGALFYIVRRKQKGEGVEE